MEWFRFYHDAVDDPKVQRLPPATFKHWINLLCLASRNNERGTLPAIADIAFGLRLSEAKVRSIIAELNAAGLVECDDETLQMHNWHVRQKRSDNVKERVDKYRASNDSVTLHETLQVPHVETLPHVRVTETETETETEQNRVLPPRPPLGEVRDEKPATPWDLFEAMCDESGVDVSQITGKVRDRQLHAAKTLVSSGATVDDIRRQIRWLSGQSWLTAGVDMQLLAGQWSKWVLAGKPDKPIPKHPPRSPYPFTREEELAAIAANPLLRVVGND